MAKTTAVTPTKPVDIEVVPPVSSETLAFFQQTCKVIAAFGRDPKGFLRLAHNLEQEAALSLAHAKTLKAPSSATEDEQLQLSIKADNAGKREIETYWDITKEVTKFRDALSFGRGRSVKMREEAADIKNKLHNRYVQDEKDRAAKEQDRLRREAEETARVAREAELADLERQALANEEASEDLSTREKTFVIAILAGVTPYAAAKNAGYKNPGDVSVRLMETPKVINAVASQRQAKALREQAAAVKEQPLDVQVVDVKPNVTKADGASDRMTKGADIFDEAAFIQAVLDGKIPGLPAECLKASQAGLNQAARTLGKLINLWPGIRYTENVKVI